MKAKVHVPAKINLALDILSRRDDGYHFVEMIMQSVDLYDTITVDINAKKNIELSSNVNITDNIEKNTAYMAAKQFFKDTKIENPGVKIIIKKKIPMQAGLAGGSADAAGVILALNKLFNTQLTQDRMFEIGEKIGADVPFCIGGGTMFSEGIGTILEPIPDLPECYIVLSKPPIGVSTKEAYEKSDISEYIGTIKVKETVDAVCSGDLIKISSVLFNRFEHVMNLQEVNNIKKIMQDMGALNACMSGSGPTVFGIFNSLFKAEYSFLRLKKQYDETFLCKPVSGCIIE